MQLTINSFGSSLRREQERFLILVPPRNDKPAQKFQISARKVQSIYITTGAHFSTDAVQLAVENNIDIVFLDKYGNPYARIWQPKLGSTTLIRRRQLELAQTPEGVKLAAGWVADKLQNQADLLKALARPRPAMQQALNDTATNLLALREKVLAVPDTLPPQGSLDDCRGTLMGYEGTAGRIYFGILSRLLPQRFQFDGRSRDPAKDEFNCLLNYGYGVLYSLVERACILAGLDPFVGFLHTDNYNKLSLVFDIIELFRVHVEKIVLKLFSSRQVTQNLFDKVYGGFVLNDEGKKLLISQLNEHLEKTVRYRGRNIKLRDTIQFECHRIAKQLLKGTDETDDKDIMEVKEL